MAMAMPDLRRNPSMFYSIKNYKDIHIYFLFVYFHLRYPSKYDLGHFLLIRNNGEIIRIQHFREVLFHIFNQIKVVRVPL